MSLTFSALPARAPKKSTKWLPEADELRANRGKWARFNLPDSVSRTARNSLALNIRSGRIKAFRDGAFEARVINGELWARNV